MTRNARESVIRRTGCVTARRPVTREDWIRILTAAACTGLVILFNIRAA